MAARFHTADMTEAVSPRGDGVILCERNHLFVRRVVSCALTSHLPSLELSTLHSLVAGEERGNPDG